MSQGVKRQKWGLGLAPLQRASAAVPAGSGAEPQRGAGQSPAKKFLVFSKRIITYFPLHLFDVSVYF